MKRIFIYLFIIFGLFQESSIVFAEESIVGQPSQNQSNSVQVNSDQGLSVYSKSDNEIMIGNFSLDDIPLLIVGMINFLLAIAGTISIVALIYHAVRMQLASGITGDSSGVDHAKKGMKGALIGFVIALSAWFIIGRFIDIMSSTF